MEGTDTGGAEYPTEELFLSVVRGEGCMNKKWKECDTVYIHSNEINNVAALIVY